MDEDNTTAFNLEEEYEGGYFGADGEYYCMKEKKKKKKQSKNDQIYGIFNVIIKYKNLSLDQSLQQITMTISMT